MSEHQQHQLNPLPPLLFPHTISSDSFIQLCRCFHHQATTIPYIANHLQLWTYKASKINYADKSSQVQLYQYVEQDEMQIKYPVSKYTAARFWRTIIAFIREQAAIILNTTSENRDLLCSQLSNLEESCASIEDTENEAAERAIDAVSAFQKYWYKIFDTSMAGDTIFQHFYRVETGFSNNIGLVAWPAGYLMAEFIIQNPHLFEGKNCIELGGGIGLTSVILNQSKPNKIICTDFEPKVIENIEFNFKLNGLLEENSKNGVGRIDWCNFEAKELVEFNCDTVIACDTTYIPEILVPFARTVAELLKAANDRAANSGIAYLAQTERHPLYFIEYLDALRECGLTVEEIPFDNMNTPQRFHYDRQELTIYLHKVTLKQ
jgi:predicted nicotinamide N-methyase